MTTILLPEIKSFTVRAEGDRVALIYGGNLVCTLPWEAARDLSRALKIKAGQAEEYAKSAQIIYDQAILTRIGAGVGLTSNPVLLRAAANEAAWNSQLRRYIPPSRAGGMASQTVVGRPTLISHPPKDKGRES